MHSKSEFYYPDEDFRHFSPFHSNPVEKNKHVICRSRSVCIGKKSSIAFSLRPRAYSRPQIFPIRTSWTANNIYMYRYKVWQCDNIEMLQVQCGYEHYKNDWLCVCVRYWQDLGKFRNKCVLSFKYVGKNQT